jgi:hypothetical protein
VEVSPGNDLALAQIARRARTLAVLRVGQAAEGIEVWVAPEVDAEAKSEWVDVDAQRPELAVVLAVEALRARFLEFGLEPEHSSAPKRLEPAPTQGSWSPEVRSMSGAPTSPGSSLWLEVGAAALAANSGVALSAEAALRFFPAPWLGIDVSGWWPISTTRVDATGGSADVRTTLALASGELRWGLGKASLATGAGLGLAVIEMKGRPAVGYVGRDDSVVTALPFGRFAFELPFTRGFGLRMATNVGVSAPRAVVRFDDRVVASWGRPFLALTLGVQGRLFGGFP